MSMVTFRKAGGKRKDTGEPKTGAPAIAFPETYKTKSPRHTASVVGVEIEGKSIHMALVKDGTVTECRNYTGDDLTASLSQWLTANKKLLQHSEVRVAWSNALVIEKTVLPAIPSSNLADAIAQYAEMSMPIAQGEALAATIATQEEDGKWDAVLLATDRRDVSHLWVAAEGLKLTCHPSPFAFDTDGLYLAIGEENYLALVVGERVTQFRYFSEAASGDISKIANETSRVVTAWARSGIAVPEIVYPIGTGSRTNGLAEAIAGVGLDLMAPPWPSSIQHLAVPVDDQAAAYVAIHIATATPRPAWSFTDPSVTARQRNAARSRKRKQIIGAGIALAVALVVSGAYELYSSHHEMVTAQAAQAQAAASVHSVQPYLSLQSSVQSLTADKAKINAHAPNLNKKLAALLASAPAGTQFGSMTMTRTPAGATVQMSAYLPGTSFAPVTAWVSQMEALGASVDLQSYSLTGPSGQFTGNGVSVQLTANI